MLAKALPLWAPGPPPEGVDTGWLLVEIARGDQARREAYYRVMLGVRAPTTDTASGVEVVTWHEAVDAEGSKPGEPVDGIVVAWMPHFVPTMPSRSQIAALVADDKDEE